MTRLNFQSDGGYAGRGALGLVVLETDETIEPEIAPLFRPVASLYHTRIPFDPVVTEETLNEMADNLPAAVDLFPKEVSFDVIGYGCTSASTVIGSDRVAALINQSHPEAAVTNPLAAVIAAARHLGAEKIGFLTPYSQDVSAKMHTALERAGFEISKFGCFEEEEDHKVALISEQSVLEGARFVAKGADMVFTACTNLRSFGVIEAAEQELGIPVVSSNAALAWHMAQLASRPVAGPGRLFKH